MTADQLSIEMLPADHGDALWIEWGASSDRHRLLIDGGTRRTFKNELERRFLDLEPDDRRLDLLVVTHIDLDHIDGVIELLRDEALGVQIDDVWFNDYRHLSAATSGGPSRGAIQGEFLSAVIMDRGLPWNRSFEEGAIVVPSTGSLPAVTLPGGLRLVLLSPTREKLTKLEKTWKDTLADARHDLEPGQRKEWLAVLEEQRGPAQRGTEVKFGADGSSANGSSIALIAEYEDERWLLAGDAHDDVLLAGITRYALDTGESLPIRLDGFKLPHHGSVRNLSPELLDAVRCRKFLVSTSGAYFKHPDEEAIELLIERSHHPELVFNYLTEFTEKWRADSDRCTAIYLDTPGDGTGEATEQPSSPVPDPTPSDPVESEPAASEPTPSDPTPSDPVESEPAASESGPSEPIPSESVAGGEPTSGTTAPPDASPITVTVHHGSLDQADHPVIVGHYLATPLSGAEGFADRRFGGRLSERLDRNTYVGAIGESVFIPAPPRRLPVEGVLVVGLGEYGELTPLQLVETIREALVRHALDVADRDPSGDVLELEVSSVLIAATGAEGLTVAASATAIVDALREANRDLRGGGGAVRVKYTGVQVFERNAAEAELAFLALRAPEPDKRIGPSRAPRDEIIRPERLLQAGGRLQHSLPSDTADAAWWRMRVSRREPPAGQPDPGHYLDLEFAIGGRLARAGVVRHQVERRRLERILRKAVKQRACSSELHTTLFELLFPNELKWDLMAAQDIQLEVDDTTADIPWEMLAARNPKHGTRGELALRAPLIRQLKVDVSGAIARAPRPIALVIGNPPVGTLGPTLPGAYEEAVAVVDVLEKGSYQVDHQYCYEPDAEPDGDTTMRIESALFKHDYRIVHMAAHGVLQPDDPTRTGVAIGPDDFVTASVLGQLNVTPDLVFLNCCHLAAGDIGIESGSIDFTQHNLNRLAASLSRQLIGSGVRAVVAAGWAVDDAAATSFAETFYRRMLDGETFSRAVHDARGAAIVASPSSSTWGAYQCYGDAGYRLPSSGVSGRPTEPPATRREVLRRLESFISWIETIGADGAPDTDRESARVELADLEAAAEDNGWMGSTSGQVAEQFARAWAALRDYERAVLLYERALATTDGDVTLRAVEQLANLRDRWATDLMRGAGRDRADARLAAEQLVTASMAGIELLERIGGSGERVALRAGHYKRRAVIAATDAERREALGLAVAAYKESYLAEQQPYTLFNYVQLDEIRSRLAGAEPRSSDLRDEYHAAREQAEVYVQSSGNYWGAVARADGTLTEAIVGDTVAQDHDELVEHYLCAFECRSTAKDRASTLDHLLDLAEIHPDAEQQAALRELCARLDRR